MIFGTDVSEWQGTKIHTQINWSMVAEAVEFGIFRVGNGHRFDFDLEHNREGASLCQVSGSYWYFEPPGLNGAPPGPIQIEMWKDGAQFKTGQIAQADIEGSLNGNDQTWLLDACHSMADYMGGTDRLYVYCNRNFAINVLTDPAWKRFPCWAAWPNGNPPVWPIPFGNFTSVPIHQYGETNVPGIVGLVDADATNLSVVQLMNTGKKAPPKPKDNDMAYKQRASDNSIFEVAFGYKFHCTPQYFFDVLGGVPAGNPPGPAGIVAVMIDDDTINSLPDWPGITPPSGYIPHTHGQTMDGGTPV